MDDIARTLHGAGFGDGWDVTATAHGSTGRTFVARRDNAAVFVKLGPVHPAFERLAGLGVTPSILACGDHDGEGFTIFRYVEGVVPDRIWMGEHVDLLVDIINVVQQDEVLTDVLASDALVPTLGEHLAAVVARLTERTKRAPSPGFQTPEIEAALERLRTARSLSMARRWCRRTPIPARPTCSSRRNGPIWSTGMASGSPTRCGISVCCSGGSCPRSGGRRRCDDSGCRTRPQRRRSIVSTGGRRSPRSGSPSGSTATPPMTTRSGRSWKTSPPPPTISPIQNAPRHRLPHPVSGRMVPRSLARDLTERGAGCPDDPMGDAREGLPRTRSSHDRSVIPHSGWVVRS